MAKKTIIGKIIEKIGDFIEDFFKGAEKSYDKVDPKVQEALVKGSEIVAVINDNVNKAPDFVYEIIQSKFPEITKDKLTEVLAKVANGLNVADQVQGANLNETIANLQALLISTKAKDGTVWAAIASTAAKLLAVFLAPKGTKWATVETLMEFVYRSFVKK